MQEKKPDSRAVFNIKQCDSNIDIERDLRKKNSRSGKWKKCCPNMRSPISCKHNEESS